MFFNAYILAPLNLLKSSTTTIGFFILMMLCGKFCYDVLCLAVYVALPKYMTDKFTPLFLLFSRFVTRLMTMMLPTIIYVIKKLGFHSFVFLGIGWIVGWVLFTFSSVVQKEGVDNLMNEFKVSVIHKLSKTTKINN